MTTILVVEDHVLMGQTLARVLGNKEYMSVVDVVQTAESALQKLKEIEVDIVLVDVSLPSMNGIDLVSKIHQLYPALPCMMLSGQNARQYVIRSLIAGARGYVIKDDIPGIFEGIEHILAGKTYISETLR